MIAFKNYYCKMKLKCDGPHEWFPPKFRSQGITLEACKSVARMMGWMIHRNGKVSCPRCVKSGAARLTGYNEKPGSTTDE